MLTSILKNIFIKNRNIYYDESSIFFHSLKDIMGHYFVRDEYLIELSKNKSVLHFGFLDSPFLREKIQQETLLHIRIGKQARYLWGVDIDEKSLKEYREITKDRNNCICDLQIEQQRKIKFSGYDLILFPEILEHLINPGIALMNLHRISLANNRAQVCITVPNAFSRTGYAAALRGVELVHPDHYYYFSPITLQKILSDSGFINIKIYFYNHFAGDSPGITHHGLIALCGT